MKKQLLSALTSIALILCGSFNTINAQIAASFTYTVNNATVNFTNTSSVSGMANYTWIFGDNTSSWGNTNNPDAVHSYNTAGTYTVTLIAEDSMFVATSDTFSTAVIVTAGCNNLAATVNATAASTCAICDGALAANVTGGNAPFSYQWNNAATTASLTNMCAGYYQVVVTDAIGCAITVNTQVDCPDSCHAEFSSYGISGNTAYFSNQSSDTSSGFVTFQWDFGDASGSFFGSTPPAYTYAAPGTYNVMLIMVNSATPCTDTIIHPVTVGGPTSCSAYFGMQQDSFILNQWYINAYATGQPALTYLWDFGDTTTSTLAMPTHTYTYPSVHHIICLTVTDANGCVSMYCDSSMNHRTNVSAASMGSVTVLSMTETATGIVEQNATEIKVWPNPANNMINISLEDNSEGTLLITDLLGNVVMQQKINAHESQIDVTILPAGYYNLGVYNSNGSWNKKIVIIR